MAQSFSDAFDLLGFDGLTEGGAFDDLALSGDAFDAGTRDGDLVFNRKYPTSLGNPVDLVFGEGGVVQPSGAINIVFDHSHTNDSQPLDIVFGDTGGVIVIPDTPVFVNVILGVPTVTVAVGITLPVTVTNIVLGKPVPQVLMTYVSNTQRPIIDKVGTSHQKANKLRLVSVPRYQRANSIKFTTATRWKEAASFDYQFFGTHQDTLRTRQQYNARHQKALTLPEVFAKTRQQVALDHIRLTIRTYFQKAVRMEDGWQTRHQAANLNRSYWTTKHQKAQPYRVVRENEFQKADPLYVDWDTHFQKAMRPPPGLHEVPIIVVPPVEPCYTPPLGDQVHLVFSETSWDTHLVFTCENHSGPGPGETIVLPIRKVYMSFNDFLLTVVSTGEVIPATDFSLSLDRDSWTYGFSAVIPALYIEELQAGSVGGSPPEISVTINGNVYRLLAENMTLNRTHSRRTISVSGRGRNAILDSPYVVDQTFRNTELRTAQQLMDDVLMLNGVSIGWDVDWGLVAWNVPAGVFSARGSYIKALQSIAAAAGGYLQPHPTDKVIRVLPGYPLNTPKWHWDTLTPDFELPRAAMTKVGVQWRDMPDYNRVFISGTNQGILGQVTRTGTDGTLIAPTITDALITHVDAARQRGVTELTKTGSQVMFDLELQILPEIGIIHPGKFLRYTEGSTERLGVVRGLNVTVKDKTRQVLTVESYDD